MSLDLRIKPRPCEKCGCEAEGLRFNLTYNLSRMWYAIYPDDERMIPIDFLSGKEVLPLLEDAIPKFIKNKNKLRELEPKNGWGTFDHFLITLRGMRNACEEYPHWRWECDR